MNRTLATLLRLTANSLFTPFMNAIQSHAPGKHRRTMSPDKRALPRGYPAFETDLLFDLAAQSRLTVRHITHA